jgi:pimeloyl-ACP methyl ester carboxylesterase
MRRPPLLIPVLLAASGFSPWAGAEDLAAPDSNIVQRDTVVVLHGLGRNKSSMWLLADRIEAAGFSVERVGYKSLKDEPAEILANVRNTINACCAQRERPVHFVGHSLGGLLVRAYLADKPVKNLGRVVLIGSPSQGTPVVDSYQDHWWMKLAGPTANALGTGNTSFPKSLPPPDYALGVIAGKVERVIDFPSIPGDDDGLVPVESTRVEGMKDFVVVKAGHAMLRYNELAAEQAIAFLKFGQFLR